MAFFLIISVFVVKVIPFPLSCSFSLILSDLAADCQTLQCVAPLHIDSIHVEY